MDKITQGSLSDPFMFYTQCFVFIESSNRVKYLTRMAKKIKIVFDRKNDKENNVQET